MVFSVAPWSSSNEIGFLCIMYCTSSEKMTAIVPKNLKLSRKFGTIYSYKSTQLVSKIQINLKTVLVSRISSSPITVHSVHQNVCVIHALLLRRKPLILITCYKTSAFKSLQLLKRQLSHQTEDQEPHLSHALLFIFCSVG